MKLEHVIGRDGLHRLRLTSSNGEIIDNSHEGFSSHHQARENLKRKLTAYLTLGGIEAGLAGIMASRAVQNIDASGVPIVDERGLDSPYLANTPCPSADPLRHERVFGRPNDPLEPQTPTEGT